MFVGCSPIGHESHLTPPPSLSPSPGQQEAVFSEGICASLTSGDWAKGCYTQMRRHVGGGGHQGLEWADGEQGYGGQ